MVDRIKSIIEQEGNNPSYFADSIGISRASINHILNGRNKPSLDMLMKILERFPEINSDWLIFGKSPMYKSEKSIIQPSLFNDNPTKPDKETNPVEYRKEIEVKKPQTMPKRTDLEKITTEKKELKKISKIMIFYSDNTFDTFSPDNSPI